MMIIFPLFWQDIGKTMLPHGPGRLLILSPLPFEIGRYFVPIATVNRLRCFLWFCIACRCVT
jgi:hypothetical protein